MYNHQNQEKNYKFLGESRRFASVYQQFIKVLNIQKSHQQEYDRLISEIETLEEILSNLNAKNLSNNIKESYNKIAKQMTKCLNSMRETIEKRISLYYQFLQNSINFASDYKQFIDLLNIQSSHQQEYDTLIGEIKEFANILANWNVNNLSNNIEESYKKIEKQMTKCLNSMRETIEKRISLYYQFLQKSINFALFYQQSIQELELNIQKSLQQEYDTLIGEIKEFANILANWNVNNLSNNIEESYNKIEKQIKKCANIMNQYLNQGTI